MTSTCSAGDVTELQVSVNGVKAGTLGTGAGSERYVCRLGLSVIVTAKFASGAEKSNVPERRPLREREFFSPFFIPVFFPTQDTPYTRR